MLTTLTISDQISAQGTKVSDHTDGRVTIFTGTRQMTGWPVARVVKGVLAALALTTLSVGAAPLAHAQDTLLNVSYDPTRELYRDINEGFIAHWWLWATRPQQSRHRMAGRAVRRAR